MHTLSTADHGCTPPRIVIPDPYNAADDLLGRNLVAGRGSKVAYIDDAGSYTYDQLAARANRCGNALLGTLGLARGDRVLMSVLDCIDFPAMFLGAIKAGVVPIAVNTLLTERDYEYMLADSGARVAVVSQALLANFAALPGRVPTLERLVVAGGDDDDGLEALLAAQSEQLDAAPTRATDPCFWLYSSGSTGAPKGTVHIHSNLIHTAELYGQEVLGIREQDVVFSAAKLFFAYGLGNGLTFPLSVGATAILMAERPTPDAVFKRLREHQPDIFYGVPTLYAGMLAHTGCPTAGELKRLRACTSAGEALPEGVGRRWKERIGVYILDGIGSTEMLHIFLSNRAGDVQYGTSGTPVPGYRVRLIDEGGDEITAAEEPGELQISGPSSAVQYWNQPEKSRATFLEGWTRSGDKYYRNRDGYYVYSGRSDDMLKVSGIYVSPIEVESALIAHEAVLEAAVVGIEDEERLIKPKAFVVLKPGYGPGEAMRQELQAHVKGMLAPYKYPRWIEFVEDLPKTATGKIQRFKLRGI